MIKVGKGYFDLVARLPLVRIADDEHLRAANQLALELAMQLNRGELDADGQAYFGALSTLIQEHESKRFQAGTSMTPIEVVKYLMEENELTQDDLAPLFGGQSCVSMFLSGKRDLSKAQIEKLCLRFQLSPSIFLKIARVSERSRGTERAAATKLEPRGSLTKNPRKANSPNKKRSAGKQSREKSRTG